MTNTDANSPQKQQQLNQTQQCVLFSKNMSKSGKTSCRQRKYICNIHTKANKQPNRIMANGIEHRIPREGNLNSI